MTGSPFACRAMFLTAHPRDHHQQKCIKRAHDTTARIEADTIPWLASTSNSLCFV